MKLFRKIFTSAEVAEPRQYRSHQELLVMAKEVAEPRQHRSHQELLVMAKEMAEPRQHRSKRTAFTLAEVLITLGIIGVVAAMTIPTLVKSYQKKTVEAQVKQVYSTLQQIIKFSEANDVNMGYFSTASYSRLQEWYNDYVSKYLKVEKSCLIGNNNGCWHSKGIVKDLSGGASWDEQDDGMIGNIPLSFVDKQGRYYDLDISASSTIYNYFGIPVPSEDYSMEIFFDVNGKNKPNVIGKDIYIAIWTDRGLIPAGYNKTPEEIKNNCLTGNGYWCLSYMMQNGWKIDDRVWDR